MSTFANATASSSTISLPPVVHPATLPIILFLILLVFIVGAMVVSLLTFCRGSASEVADDLEKNSMNEKSSTTRSIRGQSMIKLTGNLLDIFSFDFYTLIPTRRAPVLNRLTGLVSYPNAMSTFIPLQPRFITEAALESSESYADNLSLDFPLPPSTPPTPATPQSPRFAPTRLEMAAASSPVPILQFTPPTPKKIRTAPASYIVVHKDSLHPVYGSIFRTHTFAPSFASLASEPSSAYRF
ncbi:hypothetical protein HGRIS_000442 [Hohenbuehelia grisea]|uniref:Uncharacterized protein n=1 Tax=Hohenbuehelia grisea TaxID=104357 RepID=A0ABR3JR24_9AGAR